MVPPHYADVTPPVPPHYGPAEDEYDMRLASRFDPTLTSPLSPEEEPSEADSSEASGDVSQVSRAKEVSLKVVILWAVEYQLAYTFIIFPLVSSTAFAVLAQDFECAVVRSPYSYKERHLKYSEAAGYHFSSI